MIFKDVDPITGIRRILYLVTPNETSYEKVEDVPDYVQEAFPYLLLLIVLEYIICLVKGRSKIRLNDGICSLSAGIISQLPMLFLRSIDLSIYIWVYEHFCIIKLPWNSPWTWLFAFLVAEFAYYWYHRMSHEILFLWSLHQVHHSSETFNLTTVFRESVFRQCITWVFYLPMALAVPPSIFLVHIQFNFLYQFWIHTEVIRSLGPLEWILNTPSHHRVHHGRNPYCIDKNYGGTLIIFDLIFGTFQKEVKDEPIAYGLVHLLITFDPIDIQLSYLKRVWTIFCERQGFWNKLWTLVKGPSWEPGKPRLGNPADRLSVSAAVPFYDPVVPNWITAYSLVHFFLLFGLYLSILPVKDYKSNYVLLDRALNILLGLTAIGNLMDPATARYGMTVEICRLLMYMSVSASQPSYYPITYIFFNIFLTSTFVWIKRLYDLW